VVVYDHLASSRLLDLAPQKAVRLCAGKAVGHCTLNQDEINTLLISHARAGRAVVRLKGGDPLVFGRGGEEAVRLREAGVPFEIVPGVTAGLGVTAYAGIPVTHRTTASAVAFVTGHNDPESEAGPGRIDWAALAHFPGTLVIFMGVTHLAAICRTLIRFGKDADTPAAVVQAGTLPAQQTQTGTLATIANIAQAAAICPPALLVVGTVVSFRDELNWFENLPLFGQRIVVTRPRDDADRAAAVMERLGAEVLLAPTVEVTPLAEPAPLDEALDRLADYDWLVFTSVNGVRFFMRRLEERGRDLRALGHLKLAAIGPTTAQVLSGFHLRADLVPVSYRSEALADELGQVASGRRVLLARADRGRTLLKDELSRRAHVDQVAVYHNIDAKTLPESIVARIVDGTVDWITLTSSAITQRLHEALPEAAHQRIGGEVRLVSLSPVTSATATRLGWSVAVEATEFTWRGLVHALVQRVVSDRSKPPRQADLVSRSFDEGGAGHSVDATGGWSSAEFENRLDTLPEEECRADDEKYIHGDGMPAQDPSSQVEQKHQANDAGHSNC
jgi:uroporphyrinogen III methyltransferase/synthase